MLKKRAKACPMCQGFRPGMATAAPACAGNDLRACHSLADITCSGDVLITGMNEP